MKNQDLLKQLFKSLPVIARITGGFATVTDVAGCRLKTVDSVGQEKPECNGQVYHLAKKAGQKQMPVVGPSQFIKEAEAWAMPIGEYVIACSNV